MAADTPARLDYKGLLREIFPKKPESDLLTLQKKDISAINRIISALRPEGHLALLESFNLHGSDVKMVDAKAFHRAIRHLRKHYSSELALLFRSGLETEIRKLKAELADFQRTQSSFMEK